MQNYVYLVGVANDDDTITLDSIHMQAVGKGDNYAKVGAYHRMREITKEGRRSTMRRVPTGTPMNLEKIWSNEV